MVKQRRHNSICITWCKYKNSSKLGGGIHSQNSPVFSTQKMCLVSSYATVLPYRTPRWCDLTSRQSRTQLISFQHFNLIIPSLIL